MMRGEDPDGEVPGEVGHEIRWWALLLHVIQEVVDLPLHP